MLTRVDGPPAVAGAQAAALNTRRPHNGHHNAGTYLDPKESFLRRLEATGATGDRMASRAVMATSEWSSDADRSAAAISPICCA